MNMFHISVTPWIQALTLTVLVFRASCQSTEQEFLDAHNAARKEVGVPLMRWDNILADFALNYSQGQINTCSLVRASVPSGQNLAWGNSDLSATEAVGLWVNEKNDYNLTTGVCSQGFVCGHYTQVIWINSTQLGCGKVRCNNNGTFIACYYYPIGNIPGKRPTDGIEYVIQPGVAPTSGPTSWPVMRPAPIPNDTLPPDTFPPARKESKAGLVMGLSIGLTFGLGIMITWFIVRQKRKREKEPDADHAFDALFNDEFGNGIGPRNFSLNELARATSNFNNENKLGEGGFGSVYSGFLRDLDTYIAVKRVSKASKQGIKEYASEVKIISRLRHKNLVKLIGWCHERGELILVYEFMPNGSLDTHLFKGKTLLTWETRYKIVQDLASALLYLHEEGDYCVLQGISKPTTSCWILVSMLNSETSD